MGFLLVLRPPACSGSASPGGFSSPLWFTPFAMGSPPAGSRLVCPRSERRFSHQMGQVSWSVYSFARPTVSVDAASFLLMDGLRTSV